jgi:hypothetical protein
VSQQPVRIQIDWLAWQFRTHFAATAVLEFFAQLAMQVFCSPLHFIGSARATCAPKRNKPSPAAIMNMNLWVISAFCISA